MNKYKKITIISQTPSTNPLQLNNFLNNKKKNSTCKHTFDTA